MFSIKYLPFLIETNKISVLKNTKTKHLVYLDINGHDKVEMF